MSEIRRTMSMSFNEEYVGRVHVWDDGTITTEFVETHMGAACITFLVTYALQKMLLDDSAYGEFSVNLN